MFVGPRPNKLFLNCQQFRLCMILRMHDTRIGHTCSNGDIGGLGNSSSWQLVP